MAKRPLNWYKLGTGALFILHCMGSDTLERFREEMKREQVDAYVLYRRDPHLNEYLHPRYDHVKHITDFSGSNAVLLVTQKDAFLYTDSRYFLQAQKELPKSIQLSRMREDPTIRERLKSLKVKRVGVSPEYITERDYKMTYAPLEKEMEIVWVERDLVQQIWNARPEIVSGKLGIMKHQETQRRKIERTRECMRAEKSGGALEKDLDGVVIADMDEIAWITNYRGTDVPMSRLFYSFLYISAKEIVLFTDAEVPTKEEEIEVRPYEEFYAFIRKIREKTIGVSEQTNYRIRKMLKESQNRVEEFMAVQKMKGTKTDEEIEGFRVSNIKDAVYLCTLFGRISEKLERDVEVGEKDAAEMLESIKKEDPAYIGPSFETISAFGENGAVIHYQPVDNSVKIKREGLYLIDSGSQYEDGTTDITRTVCFGRATEEQKRDYTALIKGHVALERSRFPKRTPLGTLSTIVNREVWRIGKTYAHSAGHGVGFGLNVHEGPHYLDPRSTEEAQRNMVVTNEPGIYIEGEYGIRHENLMAVEEDREVSGFYLLKNLTPVPLHLGLLDLKMLDKEEIAHINKESKRMRDLLAPRLEKYPEGRKWLFENTKELETQEERANTERIKRESQESELMGI